MLWEQFGGSHVHPDIFEWVCLWCIFTRLTNNLYVILIVEWIPFWYNLFLEEGISCWEKCGIFPHILTNYFCWRRLYIRNPCLPLDFSKVPIKRPVNAWKNDATPCCCFLQIEYFGSFAGIWVTYKPQAFTAEYEYQNKAKPHPPNICATESISVCMHGIFSKWNDTAYLASKSGSAGVTVKEKKNVASPLKMPLLENPGTKSDVLKTLLSCQIYHLTSMQRIERWRGSEISGNKKKWGP